MQSISNNLLEYHPDTIQRVRKLYNLDQPGRMDESIDILDAWIKKQPHLTKKSFDRDYLERIIIGAKGSMERAKTRIDRYCTIKTLTPEFFNIYDPRVFSRYFNQLKMIVMPKLTDDYCRVFLLKILPQPYESNTVTEMIKFSVMFGEYLKVNDYDNNLILFLDYTEANLLDLIPKLSPIDMKTGVNIFVNCLGMRIRGIHLLTESRAIDAIVMLFKQVFSEKIGSRIRVHKTMDTVHECITKAVLPKEYGGNAESLEVFHEKWLDELGSDSHKTYMEELNKAGTDENLRPRDKFNEEYIGMPGTFRSLNVD